MEKIINISKGDVLFRQGQIPKALYVIRKGQVKVTQTTQLGKEVELAIIGSGNFVGEISAISKTNHTATATALMETELASIDREYFDNEITKIPKLFQYLLVTLAQRLSKTNDLVRRDTIKAQDLAKAIIVDDHKHG